MFHGVSFDRENHVVRPFGQDDLDRERLDPRVFSWVDLQAADINALNEVLRRWNIDLVLTSHFDAPEILPRIVEQRDCLAFYLYEIEDPERHLDTAHGPSEVRTARLILVLGADFVITYHRHPLDAVEHVKATCADSFRLAGRTPGFIAFLFLQRCLYDFAHLNLANDNFLDELSRGDHGGEADRLREEIAVAERNILSFKKLTASLQIVLTLLSTKRSPFISDEARSYFHEMLRNSENLRAAVDSSRDLLDGILARLQAAAATRTNEIARVLTVTSAILLPLTLVTGIYGMNFEHMPELRHPFGYFAVLAAMALLAVGLFLVFVRRGWVGTGRSPRAGRR
ncbi:MAG TPA: CorA family divalent cation transporter [Vicinamibacteria bacterium]